MMIKIPFNAWSRHKLYLDKKVATTRTKRYGYPGDEFIVKLPNKTVKYMLNYVAYTTLNCVATIHYKEEGCKSPTDFKQLWAKIHPKKGYIASQMVYFHRFSKLSNVVI